MGRTVAFPTAENPLPLACFSFMCARISHFLGSFRFRYVDTFALWFSLLLLLIYAFQRSSLRLSPQLTPHLALSLCPTLSVSFSLSLLPSLSLI